MSCQVANYREVQENDSLIVLAHVVLFYVANPTHLAEPIQILKTIVKKKEKRKKKSMKHSSLGRESCVDGKIEELSTTAWVSGSPSGAAAVSHRDPVSICDVLICHLFKYNGEQMNYRWVANTRPHTRTHAQRHREICSVHRTGSHYITVDSVTVEHW